MLRLRENGAKLHQNSEETFQKIQNHMIEETIRGNIHCLMRFLKAGFVRSNDVKNVEEKSLAHIVSEYFEIF